LKDRISFLRDAPSSLSSIERDELWNLASEYQETDREYFETSIARCTAILRFRRRFDGLLVGFACVTESTVEIEGRPADVILTSNTVVAPAYRGYSLLQRAGFGAFLHVRLQSPLRPTYCAFATYSYKSYLLLTRFATHWPRPDAATPPAILRTIDALAARCYSDRWDPERRIVRRSPRKRLKDSAAPIDAAAALDPAVRFFIASNPGHAEGDLIVCLAPLSVANWASMAGRAIERARRAREDHPESGISRATTQIPPFGRSVMSGSGSTAWPETTSSR
jgi:hypothetical protein